ncbi:MAG: hypothetical protein RI973_1092 [Bacteroidota bacterium]|jgi:hypothetical protein
MPSGAGGTSRKRFLHNTAKGRGAQPRALSWRGQRHLKDVLNSYDFFPAKSKKTKAVPIFERRSGVVALKVPGQLVQLPFPALGSLARGAYPRFAKLKPAAPLLPI